MIDDDTLRAWLPTSLGVQRYVDEVVAAGPYADLDALLDAAGAVAATVTPAETEEALSHHPRIGQRPAGTGAGATLSRSEQSSADADDPVLAEAMAQGNRAYEERFGRIFLIRAAGRSRREILAELDRRLALDDEAELAEVVRQLREIALLRLRTLAAGDAGTGPA